MNTQPLPSGLSVADLLANLPCNWWTISKIKRGPKRVWACKFCHTISKAKTCPMDRVAVAPPLDGSEHNGERG